MAGRREGAGLTCQASLVASLVYSYHLAKKALGKGLQLLQKTPLKHMHITPSVDRTIARAATALPEPRRAVCRVSQSKSTHSPARFSTST